MFESAFTTSYNPAQSTLATKQDKSKHMNLGIQALIPVGRVTIGRSGIFFV